MSKYKTYNDFKKDMEDTYGNCNWYKEGEIHSSLVARVSIERNNLGLSQKELAKKCNIPYYIIRNFEQCNGKIKLNNLLKICVLLGLKLKCDK
jgi:ribosome-binding protein aMBF1 (putative translation factor)